MRQLSGWWDKVGEEMQRLHEDPRFTFRFADDRIIPRFHLEGVKAWQRPEGDRPIEESCTMNQAMLAPATADPHVSTLGLGGSRRPL